VPFDYALKGWPATLTLGGSIYQVNSCDRDDTGLIYKLTDGTKNPHVTIHGADKEGPDDWRRTSGSFHVVVSNTKTYEYDYKGQSNDFTAQGTKKKTTGTGDANQSAIANTIAKDFAKAIEAKVIG
jgi:hypothetical protein